MAALLVSRRAQKVRLLDRDQAKGYELGEVKRTSIALAWRTTTAATATPSDFELSIR
jgi:hypothetical protein